MTKTLSKEHQIGSIVSLKSHYTRGEKECLDDISISGDDNSIPPYMIVTEILKEIKNNFDQDTGENSIKKGTFRLKVVWFNAKKYEFNERWINSSFVEVVENEHETINFSKADQIILRTNSLEIKKKRVSYKQEDWNTRISKSSLVSFCAPEMIVIGKSKFKPKDPIFDKVTHEEIRKTPTDQVKVQYYNPIADKYSEHILPVECFENADVKTDVLTKLIEASQDDKTLIGFDSHLYRIKNISYLHGIYMIQTENFIDETVKSFLLKEIEGAKSVELDNVVGKKLAPKWEGDSFVSIKKYLNLDTVKSKENSNVRPVITGQIHYIHYKNIKGKFTKRFIEIMAVDDFRVQQKDKKNDELKGYMVRAYCFLRKEERTFTFTDERLLAIYDGNIELDSENKINIEKLLSD